MRKVKYAIVAMLALTIGACNVLRKNTKPEVAAAPAPAVAPSPAPAVPAPSPAKPIKRTDGAYDPGNEELAAIKARYLDVTMKTLKDGYAIYTGACTNCHSAKNIYQFSEGAWQHILDDMAPAAKISDLQKDAVYKYILAIKATQPK